MGMQRAIDAPHDRLEHEQECMVLSVPSKVFNQDDGFCTEGAL